MHLWEFRGSVMKFQHIAGEKKSKIALNALKWVRGAISLYLPHPSPQAHSSGPKRELPGLDCFHRGKQEKVSPHSYFPGAWCCEKDRLNSCLVQTAKVSASLGGGGGGREAGTLTGHQRDKDPTNFLVDPIRKLAHEPLGIPPLHVPRSGSQAASNFHITQ